jgi:hypothetical protein
MSQRKTKSQRQLFEEVPPVPIVDLPPAVREQLCQELTQWMLARAATMCKEVGDE